MDTPVTGVPRVLLRLEGACVLAASIIGYTRIDGSWGLFALLFLAPDLALVGYAAGPRIGALAYNMVHTYLAPAVLAGVVVFGVVPSLWWLCFIWSAHIGLDRALGLGLKFPHAFSATHLGHVGRVALSDREHR